MLPAVYAVYRQPLPGHRAQDRGAGDRSKGSAARQGDNAGGGWLGWDPANGGCNGCMGVDDGQWVDTRNERSPWELVVTITGNTVLPVIPTRNEG